MKKTIATVIAGLFATAAFAQTPAPTAPKTSKPAAVLVKNADLKASKADTKTVHAEAPAAQASVNATATHEDAKPAPMPTHAKHAKSKPKHVAKANTMKDKQDSAAETPAPAAPLGQDAAPAPTPVDSAAPAATAAPAPDAAPVPATTPAPAAPVTQ
jgi:hypothetical protein